MNIKVILIVLGEPYSIFSEILAKFFANSRKRKEKIILIGNLNLFKSQIKKMNYSMKINQINSFNEATYQKINFINVNFIYKKIFSKITNNSNRYIEKCFDIALKILKKNKRQSILINGPVSKKTFLNKKYLGITEYLSNKTNSKSEVMLIYNEKFSVSPITTHIPLKYVAKNISKKKIINNVIKINNFMKKNLKAKANFAILGLNPHCETIDKYSEEEKIIYPSIKILKKRGIKVDGPFSADTFFLKNNLLRYNVVIGMYHDQVLTPIKTLFNFNAINLTIGLPFLRISPDHGPNFKMLGKNKSDPSSFFYAMKIIKKISY